MRRAHTAARRTPTATTPTPASCDDGSVCTTDSCDQTANGGAGGCVNVPVANCCQSDGDCDNGDPCDGAETCDTQMARCLPGTTLDCDDGNPCTTDSCEAGAGCAHAPTANCGQADAGGDNYNDCDGAETCSPHTGRCQPGGNPPA